MRISNCNNSSIMFHITTNNRKFTTTDGSHWGSQITLVEAVDQAKRFARLNHSVRVWTIWDETGKRIRQYSGTVLRMVSTN